MDLFTHASQQRMKTEAPLAARYALRSYGTLRTLDEYVDQEDILGPGKLLRRKLYAKKTVLFVKGVAEVQPSSAVYCV